MALDSGVNCTMAGRAHRERITENPFYVLGLRPQSSRVEIEREGQKLLAMLELKLKAAQSYQTPLGPEERTPEKVRFALAELRDPVRRLDHEVWAQLAPDAPVPAPQREAPQPEGWIGARRLMGWGR